MDLMKARLSGNMARFAVVVVSSFIIYNGASRLWIGTNEWGIAQFTFEFPLYLLMMGLLYFPQIHPSFLREGLPPLCFFLLYILFDLVYVRLHRAPDVSDLQQVPFLFEFAPGEGILLLLLFGLILGIPAYLVFRASQQSGGTGFRKPLAIKSVLTLLIVTFLTSPALPLIQKITFKDRPWSPERTIRYNGRISYFLFAREQKRLHESILTTIDPSTTNESLRLFPGKIILPRNLHLIVLESFLDPRRLRTVEFSKNPVGAQLLPYLNEGRFSIVRSPVFGGGTAQAEFELLTGVPALRKLNTPEFNLLRGGDLGAFVSRLRANGYRSLATISSGKEYYNSILAYRSLGFEEIQFPGDPEAVRKAEGDQYVFDGDLLDHHLSRIEKALDTHGQPVFSYVLGMYGHFPFHRNEERRPDEIQLSNDSEELVRITNQFLFRTRALGRFLEELLRKDPDCLVCIVSDHLPPIDEKLIDSPDPFLNSCLLLDRGQWVGISGTNYYEIPWILWDHLSETVQERQLSDPDKENLYFEVIHRGRGEWKLTN